MTVPYVIAALGAVIGSIWGVAGAPRGKRSAAAVGALFGWVLLLILYQTWVSVDAAAGGVTR